MRIAYLVNQYPTVSHAFIRREIQALERYGFEILRISLRGWNLDLADNEDFREREKTHYVLRNGAFTLLVSLCRTLLTHPIALFHAFMLACKMARRAERPLYAHLAYLVEACHVVTILRSADIKHLHAHFGTNSAEVAMLTHVLGGPSWSFTVHGPTEFDKAAFIGLAEKIKRCSFVRAISSFGRSQLYRFIAYDQWNKVEVVHCGLDVDFYSDAFIPQTISRRLVCVGRLCEQKGQLLLVEAAARLAALGYDFELVLAGDGDMRAIVEAQIADRKIEKFVRITGWISSERVRDEILAARALVLASFAEGLPVVIMEAMALKRPIISTYVAGIPELVIPGEHGWLVPAGDVDALVRAMRSCLDCPDNEISRMGQSAHRQSIERHDVNIEANKLARLFRGLD